VGGEGPFKGGGSRNCAAAGTGARENSAGSIKAAAIEPAKGFFKWKTSVNTISLLVGQECHFHVQVRNFADGRFEFGALGFSG
jgi:hypothetical protein